MSKPIDINEARKAKGAAEYRRLVLVAWDSFDHADKRDQRARRAAVENANRQKL